MLFLHNGTKVRQMMCFKTKQRVPSIIAWLPDRKDSFGTRSQRKRRVPGLRNLTAIRCPWPLIFGTQDEFISTNHPSLDCGVRGNREPSLVSGGFSDQMNKLHFLSFYSFLTFSGNISKTMTEPWFSYQSTGQYCNHLNNPLSV